MSAVLRKWLSEYKTLQKGELSSYAKSICDNEELIQELYDLFEDDLSHEVIDPVCHQLFDFYRSRHISLQRFTLELVPSLVSTYLFAVAYGDKKKCAGIEACLLGIYNLEVVNEDGKQKQKTVTIPTLAVPSLFHEPPSLASLVLTESALSRYHGDIHRTINIGPMPQIESLNAYNRLPVLTYIMNRYTADIVNLSPRSHSMLCKMCSRLAKTGFEDLGKNCSSDFNESMSSETPRHGVSFADDLRISLSSGLLVELLSAIYYVMFNEQARDGRDGKQALEDIHWRASYELYADVLLVTNAVRNSLEMTSSEQPKDVPMGISVALSPTQSNPAFSKDAITNASFRARKLPEDIDVQDGGNTESSGSMHTVDNADPPLNIGSSAVESKPISVAHRSVGSASKGPLKSIMKKREERAREKIQQSKESDVSLSEAADRTAAGPQTTAQKQRSSHIKEFLELHVASKSPRHSVSMSGMSTAAETSSVVEPGSVKVSVMRSGTGAAGNRQSLDAESTNTGSRLSRSSVSALTATTSQSNYTITDEQNVTDTTDIQPHDTRTLSDNNEQSSGARSEVISNTQL